MLYIDFEYNRTTHEFVNLVCCSDYDDVTNETKEWWLCNDTKAQANLKAYLLGNKDTALFSWAAIAEARSFISLGINPVDFKWIDGFLEYRCLTNHNDELGYGEQLIDGVVKMTKRPPAKWKRTEEDKNSGFKPKHNLAEATFKLTGNIRDTKHKDEMRDLIISDPEEFTEEEKNKIQKYCTEDVKFLPEIYDSILEHYKSLIVDLNYAELKEEMFLRGKYAALTAKMESWGYPIDYNKTKNFSTSVGPLLDECQREINQLFPGIKPFKYSRKDRRFAMDTKAIKAWLHANVDTKRWLKTDGGVKKIPDLSLSLDAWTGIFNFKHDYPKDNFGAQMVRYFKLKQNLNGFVPSPDPDKRTFWSAVGPDQRVRAYFNIYGSQSSRSQPGSTSFLFLKPAWMRSLCSPIKGKAIGAIDYGSEEFLICALVSKCQAMIDSYLSGDVYLYFSKLAGAVPWDGTRAQYAKERNIFKQVVLSISFQQTAKGLSTKLTEEMGEEFTEAQAQDLINTFYNVYPEFAIFQEETKNNYLAERIVKIPCGWYMFGDNDNFRSSNNVVFQGFGGSIMRKAVEFADEMGLKVILTLHDALYIEFDSNDTTALATLKVAMRKAFEFYFEGEMREAASKIKMDVFAWSPDYRKDTTMLLSDGEEIDTTDIYRDERALKEYEQFSKYFNARPEEDYL